jgi:hypothetical protein
MKGMETAENKNFIQDCWFSGSGSNCGSFEKRRYERVSYESVKSINKVKLSIYTPHRHARSVNYNSTHSSLWQ